MHTLNFTGNVPEFFEAMRHARHFYNHTQVRYLLGVIAIK